MSRECTRVAVRVAPGGRWVTTRHAGSVKWPAMTTEVNLHLGPESLAYEDPKVQFKREDHDRYDASSVLWRALDEAPR
jgi:hypothetical protein